VKVIQKCFYVCERCGTQYENERNALHCESLLIPPKPDVLGKTVKLRDEHLPCRSPDAPYGFVERTVTAIRLAVSLLGTNCPLFHFWILTLNESVILSDKWDNAEKEVSEDWLLEENERQRP